MHSVVIKMHFEPPKTAGIMQGGIHTGLCFLQVALAGICQHRKTEATSDSEWNKEIVL